MDEALRQLERKAQQGDALWQAYYSLKRSTAVLTNKNLIRLRESCWTQLKNRTIYWKFGREDSFTGHGHNYAIDLDETPIPISIFITNFLENDFKSYHRLFSKWSQYDATPAGRIFIQYQWTPGAKLAYFQSKDPWHGSEKIEIAPDTPICAGHHYLIKAAV